MTSRHENDPVQSVRTTEVVFDKRSKTVFFFFSEAFRVDNVSYPAAELGATDDNAGNSKPAIITKPIIIEEKRSSTVIIGIK